jgi:GTP-binding protein
MHQKGIDHAGPGGGNGGRGGDVYLRGVRDISKLAEYRFEKEFKAQNGDNGHGDCMHGKGGEDLILDLPLGTVLTNVETGEVVEVLTEEPVFFLKGGNGGYGNAHFKGPENQRPKEWTPGKPGRGGVFIVELRLIADVGFVGLPNAGKSSLLNALTRAKAKVGDYQFTTLEPNLGDMYGFILADIPGLIEGASEGRGLGDKFLRHVSRTKVLLHCISLESENVKKDYEIIREELGNFDASLLEKKEIIVLTKADSVDPKKIKEVSKLFKGKEIFTVSVIDDQSVKNFGDELVKILRKI